MAWWLPHIFDKKREFLLARARLMAALRHFFEIHGFVAVETPVLQACPTVDTHIHGFETTLWGVDVKPLRKLYLHTSPEFAMKKLLVAGMDKIYQICQVFRNGEDTRLHSSEFTMVEWYRTGKDYAAMMADCEDLLRALAMALGITHYRHKDIACDPFAPWERLSVADAFARHTGLVLTGLLDDPAAMMQAARGLGIRVAEDDGWDDLFFRIMADRIELHLGFNVPCILYDYPACLGALARRKPSDPRWAERFELYVCGIELANAFSELTDAAEQAVRIKTDMAAKHRIYGYNYAADEDFLKALAHGLPECAGIALGIDRLVMLACGAERIDDVLWCGKP